MRVKKIKITNKGQPKIRDTGRGQPLVDHELVAKALGAERVEKADANTTRQLHVVVDDSMLTHLKDYAVRERRPVSVVVRDLIIEKLRASGYTI